MKTVNKKYLQLLNFIICMWIVLGNLIFQHNDSLSFALTIVTVHGCLQLLLSLVTKKALIRAIFLSIIFALNPFISQYYYQDLASGIDWFLLSNILLVLTVVTFYFVDQQFFNFYDERLDVLVLSLTLPALIFTIALLNITINGDKQGYFILPAVMLAVAIAFTAVIINFITIGKNNKASKKEELKTVDFDAIRNQIIAKSKNNTAITLKDVQTILLEIMIEVDRICRLANIGYFLEAGTLLGAIRHQGFIPWDDDLDISIKKDDYHKLIDALKTHLDAKRFIFHCLENNKKHNITGPAIKIRRKGTYSPEPHNWAVNRTGENGLFIDVFVYDAVKPDSFRFTYYRAIAKISCYWQSLLMICGLHFRCIKNWHVKIATKYAKKYPNSPYFACRLTWTYTKTCIYLLEDSYPLQEVSFEGYSFLAQKNYDKVLTIHYHDYRQLPKHHDRRFRHINIKKLQIDEAILQAIANNTLLK